MNRDHVRYRRFRWAGLLCLAMSSATLGGCASPPVKDYEAFYAQAPFTVVVPPVINETSDTEAPRFFTATITQPLADRGYYVMPVEATAAMLHAEGITDGAMLAKTDPRKFHEFFGADGVMFVTLKAWDTSYVVIQSSVTVSMEYRLVSTRTGDLLWETAASQTITSNSGGGAGLAGLVVAVVSAVATAAGTDYVPLAMQANMNGCQTLPPGPYSPQFEQAKKVNLEKARSAKPKAK